MFRRARGQRQGPRGFHPLCAPGRACMQGPGRFGHVNVVGAGGLGGPAGRVPSVTITNTNQCDQHSAPVRKRHRGVVVTELACWVISGPRRAAGRTRTAEGRRVDARACPRTLGRVAADMRERVPGVSAVWPSVSGRMASGLSQRGVASFVHAARAPMVPYGG